MEGHRGGMHCLRPRFGAFTYRAICFDDAGNSHGGNLERNTLVFHRPETDHIELLGRFGAIPKRGVIGGDHVELGTLADRLGAHISERHFETNRGG